MALAMEMSDKSKEEYTEKMRERYSRMRGKRAKSKLLDEFTEVTGWNRKHANKVLLGIKRRSKGRRGKRGAPVRYQAEILELLKICWLAMEQPCGKRMKDMLPIWLPHLACIQEQRSHLSKISAASIDRKLRSFKVHDGKKARPPKVASVVKALVPVRAESWDTSEVGWPEVRALWNRGIEQTRSRPYFKNDQAYVEQKNYTHVRQFLGYERLGHYELVESLNTLLEQWSLWKNLFCVTMKQASKHREGSRQIRRHEKIGQTPAQRLLASKALQKEEEQQLEKKLETLNPFSMKEEIRELSDQFWKERKAILEAEEEALALTGKASNYKPTRYGVLIMRQRLYPN